MDKQKRIDFMQSSFKLGALASSSYDCSTRIGEPEGSTDFKAPWDIITPPLQENFFSLFFFFFVSFLLIVLAVMFFDWFTGVQVSNLPLNANPNVNPQSSKVISQMMQQ